MNMETNYIADNTGAYPVDDITPTLESLVNKPQEDPQWHFPRGMGLIEPELGEINVEMYLQLGRLYPKMRYTGLPASVIDGTPVTVQFFPLKSAPDNTGDIIEEVIGIVDELHALGHKLLLYAVCYNAGGALCLRMAKTRGGSK